MIGWDMHEVWCYEVDLKDMCLAHWTPGEAEPGQFIQRSTPNDIYWLSIAAENGHDIIPGSNPFNWQSVPNNDPVIPEHFWGWHSSPENFMDLPVMGGVRCRIRWTGCTGRGSRLSISTWAWHGVRVAACA